jgi:transposase
LEPFVTVRGSHSGRPQRHRLVFDGSFWIACTGAQWRDLHEHFGTWSSVYRQFRRWTLAGLWDLALEALNEAEGVGENVQMFDSPVIRAKKDATAVIPTRRSRKVQIPVDNHIFALRNRIERCFDKLKNSRRLATRYDETTAVYLGFVQIAAIGPGRTDLSTRPSAACRFERSAHRSRRAPAEIEDARRHHTGVVSYPDFAETRSRPAANTTAADRACLPSVAGCPVSTGCDVVTTAAMR